MHARRRRFTDCVTFLHMFGFAGAMRSPVFQDTECFACHEAELDFFPRSMKDPVAAVVASLVFHSLFEQQVRRLVRHFVSLSWTVTPCKGSIRKLSSMISLWQRLRLDVSSAFSNPFLWHVLALGTETRV